MPIVSMTKTFVTTAQCQPGKRRTDYYDKHNKGLVLEVRANGGATYYYRHTNTNGRQRQIKLGDARVITLAAALRKYLQLKAQVTMGEDPLAVKKRKRSVPLYSELASQHVAHARMHQKRPENTEAVLRVHILPRWAKARLDEITPQAIAAWLAEKRDQGLRPATVERIRVTLSRSFALGEKWGIPGAETNPVRSVPKRKFNNARNRYLSSAETKRLLEACDASANPMLGSIVSLLLYTGARKSELLQAKWEHVDLERRTWFIPDTKTGVPRHVPLSQPAVDVIERLPRLPDCPWFVPNPRTRKPYTSLRRPWCTARDKAQLGDLRIHDLRHSAASFMINAGIDLFTVGRILGHADHQSTMRYSHLANDTLMAAVEAGAAKMGDAA